MLNVKLLLLMLLVVMELLQIMQQLLLLLGITQLGMMLGELGGDWEEVGEMAGGVKKRK